METMVVEIMVVETMVVVARIMGVDAWEVEKKIALSIMAMTTIPGCTIVVESSSVTNGCSVQRIALT